MKPYKKNHLPQGFSRFSWGLAFLCLPTTLYPIALFLSPNFSENPNLTTFTIRLLTTFFWIYPALLLACAVFLNHLYKKHPKLAKLSLIFGIMVFYLAVFLSFKIGLIN